MKVVIVEDEKLAASHLRDLLLKYDSGIEILTVLDSVKSAVKWLENNTAYDLVFMDIQLGDGLSFEIFESIAINSPVIFTTAYNEYALKAFKVNSIDYLLKPLDFDELSDAMTKYHKLFRQEKQKSVLNAQNLEAAFQIITRQYKTRFLVKLGEHLRAIAAEEIDLFYSLEKATFLQTSENKKYPLDYSLDQLEALVDPANFFRINRKYLIHLNAIKDIFTYSSSRLKVMVKNSLDQDTIISREKTQSFRRWLEGIN